MVIREGGGGEGDSRGRGERRVTGGEEDGGAGAVLEGWWGAWGSDRIILVPVSLLTYTIGERGSKGIFSILRAGRDCTECSTGFGVDCSWGTGRAVSPISWPFVMWSTRSGLGPR